MSESVNLNAQQYHPFYSSDRCGWMATTITEGLEYQCGQVLGHMGSHVARESGIRLLRVFWTRPGEATPTTPPTNAESPQESPVSDQTTPSPTPTLEQRLSAILRAQMESQSWTGPTSLGPMITRMTEAGQDYADEQVAEAMRVAYNAMLAKAYWSDDAEADVVDMLALDVIMGHHETLAEPGTWAVVTADCQCRADERVYWVHTPSGKWRVAYVEGTDMLLRIDHEHDWDALGTPVLVREGLA